MIFEPQMEIDWTPYQHRVINGVNPYNLLSYWWSTKKAFGIALDYYRAHNREPEIMVKSRFDFCSTAFRMINVPTLVIPMEPYKVPANFHFREQFLNTQQDVICYGPMLAIASYCSLIDNIPWLMSQPENLPFLSEHLLSAHLWSMEVPCYSHPMIMELIRE